MPHKKILFGLIAVATLFAGAAHACPRTAERLICPGDSIVSHDNIIGTVLGVNPFQNTVAFRSIGGYTYTRQKSSLALGAGCLEAYCVGDKIVSHDNIMGTILAVNPYQGTIAFRSVGGYVYTRRIETLSLGLGCVQGICVEDGIISHDNINGSVLAVNPYNGVVAFQSIGGYVYTRRASSLASTEYCEDYGDYHRSRARYPLVDERVYISIELKFSLERPVLPDLAR